MIFQKLYFLKFSPFLGNIEMRHIKVIFKQCDLGVVVADFFGVNSIVLPYKYLCSEL